MGLIVSVDRLEGILLEHAPELVAPVLAEVWRIAKESKPVRKAKYPPVPVHEVGPGEVYEQLCSRCDQRVTAGAYAMAGIDFPSITCMPCWQKRPHSERRVDRVTVVA